MLQWASRLLRPYPAGLFDYAVGADRCLQRRHGAVGIDAALWLGSAGGRDRDRVDCDLGSGDLKVVASAEGKGVKGGIKGRSAIHPTS